ncbi:MAG: hypothetical protein JXO22_17160 [Phycisphaerae bacterium]|nr:hypothetical protein [Phycisphaerae bacterium]
MQKRTLVLTRGDGGPLALELLPSPSPRLTASLREIEPGERYELDVEYAPPWPNKSLTSALRIKTGVPEAPLDTLRVYGTVRARLQPTPAAVNIPSNVPRDSQLRVALRWSGGAPGHVLEAKTDDPDLTATIEDDGDKQSLVVNVPRGYKIPRGKHQVNITLKTDDPLVPALTVAARTIQSQRTSIPQRPAANPKTP